MSSSFGKNFTVTTFGESHGDSIGVVIQGCPSNFTISLEEIQTELNKRKPSKENFSTSRDESDEIQVISGIFENKSLGSPICILVKNKDHRSQDYGKIKDIYRPGHGDFVYQKKYSVRDYRGGGRSSGRETIGRVIAGAIAKQFLKKLGISFNSYLCQIGPYTTDIKPPAPPTNPLLFPDETQIDTINAYINEQKLNKDTCGCVIETQVSHIPVGIGEPVFDKLESVISHGILSIGAVNGIEFGIGFEGAKLKGSEFNDSFFEASNNSGGISAGISNGKPLIFRSSIKPPSSIGKTQTAMTSNEEPVELKLEGRFDVCLGPRIAVVIESMTAIALLDLYLTNYSSKLS